MSETKKHLLLVEDEAPLREALAERLAEHGFEVAQTDTGEGAIEQLAEFAFDIVITDLLLMPFAAAPPISSPSRFSLTNCCTH